ncbi:MAG: hypothetical protein ACK4NX_00600, partial [Candidatus Paceibacteria bacterium]
MEQNQRHTLIRKIYLYLFSLLGLVLIVIGTVKLVDLGLRMFVFKGAEEVVIWPEPPIRSVEKEPGATLTSEEKEKLA